MSEKIRIELRYDSVKDKEVIDFIDRNSSTRAGFIKSLILQYKNAMEANTMPFSEEPAKPTKKKSSNKPKASTQENKNPDKPKTNKRKAPKLGQSFSSKDLN